MITPSFLDNIIMATRMAVSRLNTTIVAKIAKSISAAFDAGGDLLTPSTIANMRKLMKSGLSVRDIEAIVENAMPAIRKEIRQAFLQSAAEISGHNTQIEEQLVKNAQLDVRMPNYTVEGIPKTAHNLNMTVYENRVLEAAYRRTNGTVQNIAQSIAPSAYRAFTEACDNAILSVQAGVSPGQAILDAVDTVAKQGITVIQYRSGRTDKIDVAIARAVRTGVNQANSEIILTRCAELGIKYVKVSQHRGARVTNKNDFTNHSWWQGKVYSLDWSNPILAQFIHSAPADDEPAYMEDIRKELIKQPEYSYPDFVTTCGYGQIEGIIGINCRHTFQAWFPEYNENHQAPIDPKDNETKFKNEQKQRQMERAMRDLRREIEADKAITPQTKESKAALTAKRKKLRQMGEALMDFCKKNNLPYHSDRIR